MEQRFAGDVAVQRKRTSATGLNLGCHRIPSRRSTYCQHDICPSRGTSKRNPATDATAGSLTDQVRRAKRPGDLAVVSIHWGSNWGYEVPAAHTRFAHWLIEGGVDLVHGHSSHHPRPIEVYRGHLILYGTGDCLDDYEGIGGYEQFRDDLRLLYFATVEPATGRLTRLWMAPMQSRQLRLRHASAADTAHLRDLLDQLSRPYGAQVGLTQHSDLPGPVLSLQRAG
jgi:poly-gamma-glutamate capsule biosynthesis protein CapA/YwtB (metallophosphatase superfamily)